MLWWDVICLGGILYVSFFFSISSSPLPFTLPTMLLLAPLSLFCVGRFSYCSLSHVTELSMGVYDRADHQETLDTAARASGTMIYATGTYGFYGYAYANLGENYQFVYT